MNSVQSPRSEPSSMPEDLESDSAKLQHPLLWAGLAFAVAVAIVFAIALVTGDGLPANWSVVDNLWTSMVHPARSP